MIQFDNSYVWFFEGFFICIVLMLVCDVRLVVLNWFLVEWFGLDVDWLVGFEGLQMLVGNVLFDGVELIVQVYVGYQFGGFFL